MKIYTITYASFDCNGNYLFQDCQAFATKEDANKAFDEACQGGYDDVTNPYESNDEEDLFDAEMSKEDNYCEIVRSDGEVYVKIELREHEL